MIDWWFKRTKQQQQQPIFLKKIMIYKFIYIPWSRRKRSRIYIKIRKLLWGFSWMNEWIKEWIKEIKKNFPVDLIDHSN